MLELHQVHARLRLVRQRGQGLRDEFTGDRHLVDFVGGLEFDHPGQFLPSVFLYRMLSRMVRVPLSPEQVRAGQRLGALIRTARAGRDPEVVARDAGISPETLRKIEVGRMPSPSFGTVVSLCDALGLPLQNAVEVWRGGGSEKIAI